jgi:hypothetical protein
MKSYFCFNRILAGVIALLLMATLFFACSKSVNDAAPNDPIDNEAFTAAGDQLLVSNIYNDLFYVAAEMSTAAGFASKNAARTSTQDLSARFGGCYIYSVDDATVDRWPKEVILDFGAGCPDLENGRVRSGILKLTFSGYFRYPGTTVTIEPLTYKVNGIDLTGKKIITNVGTNESYKYTTEVRATKLVLDTITINYSSKMTITQTAGSGTNKIVEDLLDDVYTYAGVDSLSYPDGSVAVTTVKESELTRRFECPYIGKGVANLSMKSSTAKMDYGNGVCDDSVLVTIGDKVKNLSLPR